jgi:hypothetical protein
MSDRIRCACPQCTIRGLMGPAAIITVGVLFLLDQLRGGVFSFWNTCPVILIVLGIISLAAAAASMEGHVSSSTTAAAAATPGLPTAPQNQIPGQGQGQ